MTRSVFYRMHNLPDIAANRLFSWFFRHFDDTFSVPDVHMYMV